MNKLAELFISFGCSVLLAMLCGVVVSDMWTWFVVPLGVMPIGIAHAMGIMAILGIPMYGMAYKQVEGDMGFDLKRFLTMEFVIAAMYLLMWGLAAVYHSFM